MHIHERKLTDYTFRLHSLGFGGPVQITITLSLSPTQLHKLYASVALTLNYVQTPKLADLFCTVTILIR